MEKTQILYGMDLGAPSAEAEEHVGDQAKDADAGTRSVPLGSRVFYTQDEVRSFRTLGFEPGTSELHEP